VHHSKVTSSTEVEAHSKWTMVPRDQKDSVLSNGGLGETLDLATTLTNMGRRW